MWCDLHARGGWGSALHFRVGLFVHLPLSRVSVGCSAGTPTRPGGRVFFFYKGASPLNCSFKTLCLLCVVLEAGLQRARSFHLVTKGSRCRCHSLPSEATSCRSTGGPGATCEYHISTGGRAAPGLLDPVPCLRDHTPKAAKNTGLSRKKRFFSAKKRG
jgi:hypothetical protein